MNLPRFLFRKTDVLPTESASHNVQALTGQVVSLLFHITGTVSNSDTANVDITTTELLKRFTLKLRLDGDFIMYEDARLTDVMIMQYLNERGQITDDTITVPASSTNTFDFTCTLPFFDKRKAPFEKDYILPADDLDYINVMCDSTGVDVNGKVTISNFSLDVNVSYTRSPGLLGLRKQVRTFDISGINNFRIPHKPDYGVLGVYVVNENDGNLWTLDLNGTNQYNSIDENTLQAAFSANFDGYSEPIVHFVPLFASAVYKANDIYNGEIYLSRSGTTTDTTRLIVEFVEKQTPANVAKRTGINPVVLQQMITGDKQAIDNSFELAKEHQNLIKTLQVPFHANYIPVRLPASIDNPKTAGGDFAPGMNSAMNNAMAGILGKKF